jgi:hypothetical protein
MEALFIMPAARRLALTTLVLVAASPAEAQASAESLENAGYVEPSVAVAFSRARLAAVRKLSAPRCRRVFGEFTDLAGQSLDEVLVARGETAESHLQQMVFLNGFAILPCGRRDVYAFTSPGSRSVFLCGNFLKLTWLNAASAANLLIHEMLHSLGAGEAPSPGLPTAMEISAHVELRCGR